MKSNILEYKPKGQPPYMPYEVEISLDTHEYGHVVDWCMIHLGERGTTWRSFRPWQTSIFLVKFQFINETDATQFSLTWSNNT